MSGLHAEPARDRSSRYLFWYGMRVQTVHTWWLGKVPGGNMRNFRPVPQYVNVRQTGGPQVSGR